MDSAKDVAHFCPNCKKHLATFRQPLKSMAGSGGSGGGSDFGGFD